MSAVAADPAALPPPAPAHVVPETSPESLPKLPLPKPDLKPKGIKRPSPNALMSRSDLEMLILEVNINGITREEGIDAYLPEGYNEQDVLVPLGQLAKALSFAITANPGDKIAKGWFLNEDNSFELNLKTHQVLIAGKLVQEISAKDAEIHEGDIFVKASLLEEWFGISVGLSLSDLVLTIITDEDLPFQEQWKRFKNAQRKQKKYQFEPVKVEDA